MTDQQNNSGSTPRTPRQRTPRTPVVKEQAASGRPHLLDALGVKTTDAIEALVRVVTGPLDERVKVLETEKNDMEQRLKELPATIEKGVIARLAAAQNAAHEAWLKGLGVVQKAKQDIEAAADGGTVTPEVGLEAKGIADEASAKLEISERNFEQSLLEFDKLASRIKRVEDILEIQEDGKSKRLDDADKERHALRELLGFDPETGKAQIATDVAAHATAIKLLGHALEIQEDGASKRLDGFDSRLGVIVNTVNANATATIRALRPHFWLAPWFWAIIAGAVTAASYSLCVLNLHWKWNGLLVWTVFNAVLVGCLAWIVGAFVARNSDTGVQYAEANATANVVNRPAEANPQWNDLADQLFRPQAPADATRVDASASAQTSS